jgi:protein gp37
MATTKIEWADAVWNPITGCTPISEACNHCYAKRMANRLKGRAGYPADEPFSVTAHHDKLDEPEKWKKPRRIFVCSMGDLFHDEVCDNFPVTQVRIFNIMFSNPKHTFMVLTKRPQNLQKFVSFFINDENGNPEALPPNVWIGVTAENQARADERTPVLLQIPAAVRFVSIEPILGPIELRKSHGRYYDENGCNLRKLDWVIVGGETGPGARHPHPMWFVDVVEDCKEAGIPVFVKKAPAGVQIIREFPTR